MTPTGAVVSILFLFLAGACSAGHLVQLALCSTPGSQRTPSSTWQTSPEPPSMRGQRAPPGGPAPTLLGLSSLLSGGPVWGCATMLPASNFAPKLTHNALHTQAWSPSSCSHTIPRDRASEFISYLQPKILLMGDCALYWPTLCAASCKSSFTSQHKMSGCQSDKTTPSGVKLMRSQVVYRAAQCVLIMLSQTPHSGASGAVDVVKQQLSSLRSPGISSHAYVLQPTQSQTALAARTVSWNPANFSQAAGWLSEAGNQGSDAGRNSQADYAPGGQAQHEIPFTLLLALSTVVDLCLQLCLACVSRCNLL
jgi:hypothetical protein